VTPVPTVTPTPCCHPVPTVTPTPCCHPVPVARCVAPRVVGLTLAQAKRKITAAHCKPGTVRRAYSRKVRKGRVVSQKRLDLVVSRGARK
jgi:PASTA domain